MKIKCLIISDTHGNRDLLRKVLRLNPDADAVIFLGDGVADLDTVLGVDTSYAVFAVRGNCDISPIFRGSSVNPIEKITLGGKRILMTHGHLYGAKGGLGGLMLLAVSEGADVVLFGHTHKPWEEFSSGVYLFNPGSLSYSYGSSPSFGLMTIDEDGGGILFSHGAIC